MKPVHVGRLAQAEIDAALAASFARSPARAAVFRQTIADALNAIAANPQITAVASRWGDRRYILKGRFPFSVVYVDEPNVVWVIAFAHHKRRPGYWARRLRRP